MDVESADGVELLLDAGLERRVTGSADVEIRGHDGRWTLWEVKVLRHSPSPAEIERAMQGIERHPQAGVLFVVARAGRALTAAAHRDHRIAYAAVEQGDVLLLGELHDASSPKPRSSHGPARTSWTRLAALRVFALLDGPLNQSEIARRIGVSHVAVGKQLGSLEPVIERTQGGWRAVDRGDCWDAFMSQYPGPRGLTTFWSATGDLAEQVERLESTLSADDRATWIFSGDLAADVYAPWRRPTRVTAYATHQPRLDEHGFAAVRSGDATIEVRVAKDPTISAMSRASTDPDGLPRRLADPLITAWDLARSPGGDVESAVQRLRERALHDSVWP